MMIQDCRMCASGCSMNRSHQTGCASANYNYIICFLFHKNSFYLSSSKKFKISFVISSISPSGSSSPAFSSVDAVGFTVYTGFSDSESSLFSFSHPVQQTSDSAPQDDPSARTDCKHKINRADQINNTICNQQIIDQAFLYWDTLPPRI